MDPILITIPEAAAVLSVSRRQIYNWINSGRLERKKLSTKVVRVTTRSVKKLVERAQG